MTHLRQSSAQLAGERGVALLEVLVALLITAFGILGLIGLQARTAVGNLEAYQRSQALILVNDMAERISVNRANAAAYVVDGVGVTDPGDCTSEAVGVDRDLCEWALSLRGAGEKQGTALVGAVLNARGCIESINNPTSGRPRFQVSVAWQGMRASGAPANACGKDTFSSEDLRRAVAVVVQVADLSAPAAPAP